MSELLKELCDLESKEDAERNLHPLRFGKYVRKVVYETFLNKLIDNVYYLCINLSQGYIICQQ